MTIELTARQERHAAIYSLLSDIRETEDSIKTLEAERNALRNKLSALIALEDDMRFHIPGVAHIRISNPSQRVSWDSKGVERVMLALHDAGLHEYAHMLRDTQKVSQVAGTLRIDPDKAK